jgi:hypothetical protein
MTTLSKTFSVIRDHSKKGEALNAREIAGERGLTINCIARHLKILIDDGKIKEAGKDADQETVYLVSKHRNPSSSSSARKVVKKALDWFGKEGLVTEPRVIKIPEDLGFVEIGKIVAIEYESSKFDGKSRVYRHEVTKNREMHLSTDGSVIIIKPGFKVTKRGIEG